MVLIHYFIFYYLFYIFNFFHGPLVEMFDFIKVFTGNVLKMKLVEFGLYFDTLFFAAEGVPIFV